MAVETNCCTNQLMMKLIIQDSSASGEKDHQPMNLGSSGEEEELEAKFDQGFGELASMDVIYEEEDDDKDKCPIEGGEEYRRSDWWDNFDENEMEAMEGGEEEYRRSDWWDNFDENDEDDIIEPKVWEYNRDLYNEQIKDSDGFDVDDFEGRYCALGMIIPMPYFEEAPYFEIIKKLTGLSIETYNKANGTDYQFVEVENVTSKFNDNFVYYITFKAKQVTDFNAETTFQAVGFYGIPDKKGREKLIVDSCRLKRTA